MRSTQVLLNGAGRTYVLCSTRRTLQTEKDHMLSKTFTVWRARLKCGSELNLPGSSWLLLPIRPTNELTLCPLREKESEFRLVEPCVGHVSFDFPLSSVSYILGGGFPAHVYWDLSGLVRIAAMEM